MSKLLISSCICIGIIAIAVSVSNKFSKAKVTDTPTPKLKTDTPIGFLPVNPQHNVIQLALLLDVSNSMDGLIDQAKAELWSIVNEVAKASKNGYPAKLEIALYEYGRESLSSESGYIRKLLDYTSDLDTISLVLFNLKTNGGDEYCGRVIAKSLNALKWNYNDSIYKVIFIAGNEPFDQGITNYRGSCANANLKHIIINTIHCGDSLTGVNEFWRDGAIIGKGEYFFIDQNSLDYVEMSTPYDNKINSLNDSLNITYMAYGSMGAQYKNNQVDQDRNAMEMSPSVAVKRAESKANNAVYSNTKWDVVDAYRADSSWLAMAKDKELPSEMKGKTMAQKKNIILLKERERAAHAIKIATLNKERKAYLSQKNPDSAKERTLGTALISAIRRQAMAKGFVFVQQ